MTDPATPPVTFDYAAFVAAFPEMAGLSQPQAQNFFNRATYINANSVLNPQLCTGVSAQWPQGVLPGLLNLLTAHIAYLNAPRDAQGNPSSSGTLPPMIVGRINSASEGSVSVGAEWSGSGSPSEAWFLQTRYGAEYWQATAQFRTAVPVLNPQRVAGTGFPYGYGAMTFQGRFGRLVRR